MPTSFLEIEGQGSCNIFCKTHKAIQISRIKPAILNDHMNYLNWLDYCNKVDEALDPLMTIRIAWTLFERTLLLSYIFFGLFIVKPPIHIASKVSIIIIMIVGINVFSLIIQIIIRREAMNIFENVKQICDETSNQYSRLTFDLKRKTSKNSEMYCSYGGIIPGFHLIYRIEVTSLGIDI